MLRIVDSITELSSADAGCLAVSGSHGGLSSARYALAARPLLSVFNDAGVGKDAAGIAALDFLQGHGLAACAVAHSSACIGQAASTLSTGIVSHANALAAALGVRAGMGVQACLDAASGAMMLDLNIDNKGAQRQITRDTP
jgi:Na+/phosphate symporter